MLDCTILAHQGPQIRISSLLLHLYSKNYHLNATSYTRTSASACTHNEIPVTPVKSVSTVDADKNPLVQLSHRHKNSIMATGELVVVTEQVIHHIWIDVDVTRLNVYELIIKMKKHTKG